jgi:DNA-binding MarR family transcriptional regulator
MNATGSPLSPPPRRARAPKELVTSVPFLLKRVGFAVKERLVEAFEPTGLGMYHHAVLALLHEEARETQATIADALGLDRSHLVGVLDELEEKGLVERRRDPDDRRRQMVSLTAKGEQALSRLRTLAKEVDDAFLEPLSASERKTLRSLLARLASHHDPRYRSNGG